MKTENRYTLEGWNKTGLILSAGFPTKYRLNDYLYLLKNTIAYYEVDSFFVIDKNQDSIINEFHPGK